MINYKTVKKSMFFLLFSMGSLHGIESSDIKYKETFLPGPLHEFDYGWTVEAGLLVQQMYLSEDSVCRCHHTGSGTVDDPVNGNIIEHWNFDFDVGLHVGISKKVPDKNWSVSLEFDWLSSRGFFAGKGNPDYFSPMRTIGLVIDTANTKVIEFATVETFLPVDFYSIDASIHKMSHFTKRYSLEALAGLNVTWLKRYSKELYSDDISDAQHVLAINRYWIRVENINYLGVGPMIGLNTKYNLVKSWSLFAHLAVAVLFGESSAYIDVGFGPGTEENFGLVSQVNSDMYNPLMHCRFGLQYEEEIINNTQSLCAQVAFDGRYYLNLLVSQIFSALRTTVAGGENSSQLQRETEDILYGGFGMQGLLFNLRWSY